ncbi:hypothetical protein PMAYCL1PPCAC_08610, partial [Pristionchus mayeri]
MASENSRMTQISTQLAMKSVRMILSTILIVQPHIGIPASQSPKSVSLPLPFSQYQFSCSENPFTCG